MLLQHRVENYLLARLAPEDFALIASDLELSQWRADDNIVESNRPVRYAYFPTKGIVSVVATTSLHKQLQIRLYGREGSGPLSILLGGSETLNRHVMLVVGATLRIDTSKLTAAIRASASLRNFLLLYVQAATAQANLNALSNASEVLTRKLARWLLMSHDRLDGDEIAIKHEVLAQLLGVRRAGITDACHLLEGQRVIRANRGLLRITDRAALERLAGDTYGVAEDEYERLLGPIHNRRAAARARVNNPPPGQDLH